MSKAIVLLSGGMDSCVTAASAYDSGNDLAFIHFNYGQRTEARELQAFNDITQYYSVRETLLVDMSHLVDIGGSCLTDKNIPVPEADPDSLHIPISYVPFRNANMLAAAASWAEVIHAGEIYIGAVEEDSSGYPDCRRVFYDAFERAIDAGTKPDTGIKLITPLVHLDKSEIVRLGDRLHAPFGLTWSCYKSNDIPCGRCDSCVLRSRGFDKAGMTDPLLKAGK